MSTRQRIVFVIQRLSGSMLGSRWAAAAWQAGGDIASDYNQFIQELQDVFDHLDQGRSGEQKQGNVSVPEYTIGFRVMAVDSGWNEPALLAQFHDGLHTDIQLELACRNAGMSLITMAIKLDQHLHGQGYLSHAHAASRHQSSHQFNTPTFHIPTSRRSLLESQWMSAHCACQLKNASNA